MEFNYIGFQEYCDDEEGVLSGRIVFLTAILTHLATRLSLSVRYLYLFEKATVTGSAAAGGLFVLSAHCRRNFCACRNCDKVTRYKSLLVSNGIK
jgi:hypothetical protein